MHRTEGPSAEQHIAQLRRILDSISNVDDVYMAWNARAPGWDGGPVFEPESRSSFPSESDAARWRVTASGTTYRVADASFQRIYLPVRYETGADNLKPHARPLAGLAAFRHAVEAEVRFLSQSGIDSPERTSNAGYMESFWGEVLMHLLSRGPVLSLNTSMHYAVSPSTHRRALSDASYVTLPAGTGAVRINIVAEGGKLWVRLVPTRTSALLTEFREADSSVALDAYPTHDEAIDCSIMRAAREVALAAQTSATPPDTLELVLTRLDAPKTPLRQIPPVSSEAYWTAPEKQRFDWRLAQIVASVEQLGIKVRFGTVEAPLAVFPSPPPPVDLPPTLTLNLDVSALLGLTSDVSHSIGALEVDQSAASRPLSTQLAAERGTGLFEMLANAFSGVGAHQVILMTTKECAAKFRDIVQQVGSPSEVERANVLLPESVVFQPNTHERFWYMTDVSQSTTLARSLLALPVRIFDEFTVPRCTYADDNGASAFSEGLSGALDTLLAKSSTRPKALSNSLHTWQALHAGVKNRVTTLSAHAHGLRELLTANRIEQPSAMPHTAAIWLMRPRSLAGRASRLSDTSGVSPVAEQKQNKQPSPMALEISHRPAFENAQFTESPSWSPIQRHAWDPLLLDTSADEELIVMDSRSSLDINDVQLNQSEVDLIRGGSKLKRRSWGRLSDTPLRQQSDPDSTDTFTGATRLHIDTPLDHASTRKRSWLEIKHYPWWPLGMVEKTWSHLTHNTAWKSAQDLSLSLDTPTSTSEPRISQEKRPLPWRVWLRAALLDWNRNRIHWISLALTCLLWFIFKCMNTVLLNPRTVGNVQYNYRPLVVGGPISNETSVYRGDSFICAAAQHAGVTTDNGGCGIIRRVGMFSGYRDSTRNAISSMPFEGVFPLSFTLTHSKDSVRCDDDRTVGYVLNVIMSAFVTFVLRPQPAVLFWILASVGFWHVNFVSELRDFPPPVGAAVGDFLPYLFGCYCIWRVAGRFLWPRFERFPLEFGVWTLGFWWIGVLMTLVFEQVPLQRLVLHDIVQQPGGVASFVVIILIAAVITVSQVLVIRSTGHLPKYLFFYILGLVIMILGLTVPGEGLRIHHYIVGLIFIPSCAFPTRFSLILFAFLFGMYINGVARWGFDGILQDLTVIQGDATGNSLLPEFSVNAHEWLTTASRIVTWKPIPDFARDTWDSYMLLVDDVLRYHGPGRSFDLASLQNLLYSTSSYHSDLILPSVINSTIQNSAHYLRLAYAKNGVPGDFTMVATAFLNGTWIDPPFGRT
ncbi:hypothetical protein MCUN1_000069 [Malassezia cuniculi]|uniref:LCCL domain-containing protein n=1 Tax=Malassezia cuniculi TaxID=948313 RepID=A0AAF0J9F6_9BASI|nr:hypothetical protein MCUN1_000069 [Malassezia cuniculi]